MRDPSAAFFIRKADPFNGYVNACRLEFFRRLRLAALVIFFTLAADPAPALETIDSASGTEPAFTANYVQKSFGNEFHNEETYGVLMRPQKDLVQFHKSFKVAALYNDNILNSRIDPIDDQIFNYAPQIGVSRKTRNGYVETFYDLTYTDYAEHHKLNTVNHENMTKFSYKKNRLSVDFSNSIKPYTTFATGERTELDVFGTQRVKTHTDDATFSLEYTWSPKTKTAFIYAFGWASFLPSGGNTSLTQFNVKTHGFTPQLYYAITPKTNVYASYNYQIVDYYKGGLSSSSTTPSIGVVGRLTPKTSLNVDAGWKKRDYVDSSTPAADGFVLKGAVNRKLMPKISATFSVSKDVSENFDRVASQSLQQEALFYGLNLSYLFSPRVSVDVSAGHGTNSSEGLVTIQDIEGSGLFTREMEDEFTDWDIRLKWTPRPFCEVGLGYEFEKKNSSFKNFEYDKHQVYASAGVRF